MEGIATVTPVVAVMAVVIGYLCGSIPFGLLLTRWAGLGDVRTIGSGNIGATNVLRTGSKTVAALTLVCDALKATAPILLMRWFGGETAGLFAAFAAFAGHLFPVWLRFKGGKGVATYIGLCLGLAWPLAVTFLAAWLIMAFVLRRSSLSALVATALNPGWAWLLGTTWLIGPLAIFALIIWFMHRANIARLLKGQEPKIDLGARG
ncbi:glycerol-3-phosphate 1-O-acyltransferase PlsY [soil metagenome]